MGSRRRTNFFGHLCTRSVNCKWVVADVRRFIWKLPYLLHILLRSHCFINIVHTLWGVSRRFDRVVQVGDNHGPNPVGTPCKHLLRVSIIKYKYFMFILWPRARARAGSGGTSVFGTKDMCNFTVGPRCNSNSLE